MTTGLSSPRAVEEKKSTMDEAPAARSESEARRTGAGSGVQVGDQKVSERQKHERKSGPVESAESEAVSYTHLTLPTIYSV